MLPKPRLQQQQSTRRGAVPAHRTAEYVHVEWVDPVHPVQLCQLGHVEPVRHTPQAGRAETEVEPADVHAETCKRDLLL